MQLSDPPKTIGEGTRGEALLPQVASLMRLKREHNRQTAQGKPGSAAR